LPPEQPHARKLPGGPAHGFEKHLDFALFLAGDNPGCKVAPGTPAGRSFRDQRGCHFQER